MLWDKKRYIFTISGGTYAFNTDAMRGFIRHLMVIPAADATVWDMTITDKDNDIIYQKKSEVGRLDDREGIPIGLDSLEKFTVAFSNVSSNEEFKVIFKTREKL